MKCQSLCVLFIAVMPIAAQTASEVEITAEPHHHLVLNNKYVRVFKVDVPPHQATLMHRHRHDYAYVTIGSTDVSNDVKGKPAAELKLQDGETRFTPGNFAHIARALAGTEFRNVTIEFLQDRQPAKPAAKWDEDRGLQILDGGTQEILFVKDGVRASDVQLNPGATLPKNQRTAAELLVSVTPSDLHTSAQTQALAPGDVVWLSSSRSLHNSAKNPARFIIFEFR